MTRSTAQMTFVASLIRRGKAEIIEDYKKGILPRNLSEFGDLHDHVDANEYAGLCEDEVVDQGNALFPARTDDTIKTQEFMDICEEVQNALDAWIKDRSRDGYLFAVYSV